MARDTEAAAEIVPECHTELCAGLGEAEEDVAAIPPRIAACSGTDLPPCDLAADVVLGTAGVQWCLRTVEHGQRLGLIGMQAREQAVQRGKAGAASEDAVERRAQRERRLLPGLAW